jgi:putative aldouronate transport system substrate-binding protein
MYQANGNKPFLAIQEGTISSIAEVDDAALPQQLPASIKEFLRGSYTCVGACFGIDASSGSPKVVNMMETDAVRLYQEAMFRYKMAGYVTADETEAQISYSSGLADFSYAVYGSSNYYYPVTDPVLSFTRPRGYTIGVAASSKNPDAGKTLLSLIAEDEAFRIQLLFGKEGRDYTAINGNYRVKSQADDSSYSMRFLSPLSYFSGFAPEGAFYIEEGQTDLESFQAMLDRSTLQYPIVFDFSGLEKELKAVQKVINRYFPNIATTKEIRDDFFTPEKDPVPVMNEAGYDQMLQAFKDAGGDKIVAELQRQLDAWLAENPDW